MRIQNKALKAAMVVIAVSALSVVGLEMLNSIHLVNASALTSTAHPFPTKPLGKPPFHILLNGSAVYPSYTVTSGHNIVILVDMVSNQTYPVSVVARYQSSNGILPDGMTLNMPVSHTTIPVSHIPLSIHLAGNVKSGVYPMAVDATYLAGQTRETFQAGFNLYVQG
ncbi:MAG: hypothetical protein KGI33_04130 [Thaumarchaeota archaeon]|nr:hypothetical protein [Nitrososphaerota archaeon]